MFSYSRTLIVNGYSMKAAIISNRVTEDIKENQKRILCLASKASDDGAEFILFPEAAATGLVNSGDSKKDYEIAEAIPGPRNSEWSRFASEHSTYFGAGIMERDGDTIFDSAVLYNPEGKLILHYRRVDPGWHSPDEDTSIYCEGSEIPVVESSIGRLAFLICGDLWNDEVLRKLKAQHPRILLYVFARDIEPKDKIETKWQYEFRSYQERWTKTDSRVLAVNLLGKHSGFEAIGGSWFVDIGGQVIASSPILEESILFVNI